MRDYRDLQKMLWRDEYGVTHMVCETKVQGTPEYLSATCLERFGNSIMCPELVQGNYRDATCLLCLSCAGTY